MVIAPSGGAPIDFMAAPVIDQGVVIGVLIAQLSNDEIDNVVTGGRRWRQEGFGASGEAYLVGPDQLVRSTPRAFYGLVANVQLREHFEVRVLGASPSQASCGGMDRAKVGLDLARLGLAGGGELVEDRLFQGFAGAKIAQHPGDQDRDPSEQDEDCKQLGSQAPPHEEGRAGDIGRTHEPSLVANVQLREHFEVRVLGGVPVASELWGDGPVPAAANVTPAAARDCAVPSRRCAVGHRRIHGVCKRSHDPEVAGVHAFSSATYDRFGVTTRRPEVVREGPRAAGSPFLSERPVWSAASSNANSEDGRQGDAAEERPRCPLLAHIADVRLLSALGRKADVSRVNHRPLRTCGKSGPSSTSSPLAVSPVLAVLERRQSDGRRQTCGPPLGPEKERDRAEEQKVSDTSASSSAE